MPTTDYALNFAGYVDPQTGRGRYGWVVRDCATWQVVKVGRGTVKGKQRCSFSPALHGLLKALDWMVMDNLEPRFILISNDSRDLVGFLGGEGKWLPAGMLPLLDNVRATLERMEVGWQANWIPPEKNYLAAKMSGAIRS
jgi:hypothetical protein